MMVSGFEGEYEAGKRIQEIGRTYEQLRRNGQGWPSARTMGYDRAAKNRKRKAAKRARKRNRK